MLDFDGPSDWIELEKTPSSHRKDLNPKERRELWLAAVLLVATLCSDWL
jgi:hypothetical protein